MSALAAAADTAPVDAGYFIVGSGEPVVMLHASLGAKSQWTTLADRLAPRFRAIAIDLWGYGGNPMPFARNGFSLDDEARLVMMVLAQLLPRQGRVHLVGHSYGGLVALRVAQALGERIASLSLYEPVAFGLLDNDATALAEFSSIASCMHRMLATGRRLAATQAFIDFWSRPGAYASLPPDTRTSLARNIDKVALDIQAALGWRPERSELQKIVAPALLLAGKRSPQMMQQITAQLWAQLPAARSTLLDTGHMGPVSDPGLINPRIEAFVRECAGVAII